MFDDNLRKSIQRQVNFLLLLLSAASISFHFCFIYLVILLLNMYLINQKIKSQFEFLSRQIEHERRLITEQLNQVNFTTTFNLNWNKIYFASEKKRFISSLFFT
jgi:hypothetical protein